jgi:hypothetical protein
MSASTPIPAITIVGKPRTDLAHNKAGPRVNLSAKINTETARMAVVVIGLIGLGLYAWDFVYEGVMAKAALNLSIIGIFCLAAGIAFVNVIQLHNEKKALDALRRDFGDKRPGPEIVDQPGIIFKKPKLLGYGYRLVTEELLTRAKGQLPTETIHMLVKDVDQRISDAKATMGYFGGLLVFMGLLGAFMGLMKTVHSVGELIGSLNVSGTAGGDAMGAMIEGMKKPLNGMSVGFSSSLFGLLFSMVVGVLDRFMASAMKAVRNEFEACLIDLAHLEMAAEPSQGHGQGGVNFHFGNGVVATPAPAAVFGDGVTSADTAALIEVLRGGVKSNAQTAEQLAQMNHNLFALATSIREAVLHDRRKDVGDGLEAIAKAQRELAMQLTLMRQEGVAHQQRVAHVLEASARVQADSRHAMEELAARLARVVDAVALDDARMPAPNVQVKASGAQALMDRLSQAFGGAPVQASGGGGDGRRVVDNERARKLEQAVLATQHMSRQVIKRIEESQRDEALASGEAERLHNELRTHIDALTRRLDDVMDKGEVIGSGRIERLTLMVAETKAQIDSGMARLESQVTAGKQQSERAERAAIQAAKIASVVHATQRKAVGE